MRKAVHGALVYVCPFEHGEVFNDYWRQNVEKRATLEFARDRKSMSVLCNDPKVQAENLLYVKGAPESILDRCSSIMLPDGTLKPLSENARQAVLGKMLDMAGEALRSGANLGGVQVWVFKELDQYETNWDFHPNRL